MLSTMQLTLESLRMAVETGLLRHAGAKEMIDELDKGRWSKITATKYLHGNPQSMNITSQDQIQQKYLFLGGDSTLVLGGKQTTANANLAKWILSAVREYCEKTFPCIVPGGTLIGVLAGKGVLVGLRQSMQLQQQQGMSNEQVLIAAFW